MKSYKSLKPYILAIVLACFIYFGIPALWRDIKWLIVANEVKAQSIGFPLQYGLKGTTLTPCVPVPPSNACPEDPLCATMAPGLCGTYSAIRGLPAGGSGPEFLVLTEASTMSGYVPGLDVIAAGKMLNFIDVMATPMGCYGCAMMLGEHKSFRYAIVEKIDDMVDKVKYIIALRR